ncbi:MAG TPA: SulP family inorganic anion transporter [Flavobacterium sp.]|jgi:MFS superfamily sulfate permease-like transporter|nr:SulP family inorganic anion transporter [Flavobacterium sp.]HQX04811.1 SulP family inorganic anion transporter [Flavobacterium sp.]HRB92805.1 SulP family inorganic anion transporter [Chitinophagales bacterium]HRZ32820.1 SulP family inorganic anion transporter [Flavobacterium sp.]
MKRTLKYYKIMVLKYDLSAGLIVFLVALPLCLGISLASGAPVYAGLLSGIIGGIVVGFLSGSNLGVSGPAAGLTTLVAGSIISLGGFQTFLLAVIVAGLFQLLLGILKLGGIANYFPSAVIKGMLAAIGILLISKQVPLLLGYDQPDFWTSGFLDLFSINNFLGNVSIFNQHISKAIVIIGFISISILILYPFLPMKLRMIPAPLMVVIVGIVLVLLKPFFFEEIVLKESQLVNVPSNIFSEIQLPDFSKFLTMPQIWKDGLIIGLLATLETLLCVEAIDKLDKRNRITPVNRELVAQGIGNILCGLVGAIPMTAVVVRGAANADAGAKTKFSAIIHGLFLLLAVVSIPFILNLIPYASLAAILFLTGYNLAKPKLFKNMWQLGLKQFLPFIITIVVILLTDLLIGVSIGLLFSIYFIIQNNFKDEFKVATTKHHDLVNYLITFHSNVTFLNKVKLRTILDKIPEYSVVTIDGSNATFVDYDILEIISEFANKAHNKHIQLNLIQISRVDVTAVH